MVVGLHLHTKSIVHANLNPESVRLDKMGSLKIGDLCYAATASSRSAATSDHARVLYGSPEHLTGELTKESDYFSVGMLLYEHVSGRHPFWQRGPRMLFPKLQTTDVDKALDAYRIRNNIKAILQSLLSPQPSQRRDGWQMLRDHRTSTRHSFRSDAS
jgi:serine/threonine protein kinase